MRILIAEDDVITSRILESNLKNWDYEVILAKSGKEAWEALQDGAIRLAILDWMMPKMDGTEICQKIRRRRKYKYTYLILLSAKDRKQDIIAGLSSGADDYMTKPVNFLELKARLQTGRRIIDLEDKLLFVQNQLKDIASRDSLTKLWNREEIFKFLEEEVERGGREKRPLGAVMIDIDNFKKINDIHGHDTGDRVLLQVSSRIKKKVRKSDKIGRYGGDEIFIVLPNCGIQEVKKIAERLCGAISRRGIKTSSGSLAVTISAGCASSPHHPHLKAEQLLKAADEALYRAKSKGRNCVFVEGLPSATAKG